MNGRSACARLRSGEAYEFLALICSRIPAAGIQVPGFGYLPPFQSTRCSSDRKRLFLPQVPPLWTTASSGDTRMRFPWSASIKIRSEQWAQASSSLIRCPRYWLLTNSRKSIAQGMPKRSSPSKVTVWKENPNPSRNLSWSSVKVYSLTGRPSGRTKKPSQVSIRTPLLVSSGPISNAAPISWGDGGREPFR